MAKLKNKILGKVSGSLGDITFRQRNGSNYLASRPTNFSAPQDIDSITRRKKFLLSVKLASILNSIPEIKLIWTDFIPAGTQFFNHLVKTNYKNLETAEINSNTLITPIYGFASNFESVALNSEGINVVLLPVGTNAGIDLNVEKKIKLISILCLNDPLIPSLDDPFFINIETQHLDLVLDANITFVVGFSNQITDLYAKYNVHKILFALITLDENNHPVHYSNTILKQ